MARKTPEQLAQEFEGRKAKGLAKGGAAYWPNILANAVLRQIAARAEITPQGLVEAVEAEGSSCAEVMADTAEEGSGSLIADADQLEVGEATVSEDEQSAMVETSYDGNEGAITLVKVDDEWRVSLAS